MIIIILCTSGTRAILILAPKDFPAETVLPRWRPGSTESTMVMMLVNTWSAMAAIMV